MGTNFHQKKVGNRKVVSVSVPCFPLSCKSTVWDGEDAPRPGIFIVSSLRVGKECLLITQGSQDKKKLLPFLGWGWKGERRFKTCMYRGFSQSLP